MSAWPLRPDVPAATLSTGGIEIDRGAKKVRRGDRELRLGPVEFRLLELLASEPDRVFSRADIHTAVWGVDAKVDIRTIDAHVRHLRRALGRDAIRSARGLGYAFNRKASRT